MLFEFVAKLFCLLAVYCGGFVVDVCLFLLFWVLGSGCYCLVVGVVGFVFSVGVICIVCLGCLTDVGLYLKFVLNSWFNSTCNLKVVVLVHTIMLEIWVCCYL